MRRRRFLQLGLLGGLGLSLPTCLRLRASAAAAGGAGQARSAILLWLNGGPTHHDTFDPKPDAVAEIRGAYAPIATSVTGIRVAESLPLLARQAHRLALVRSVTHPDAAHEPGQAHMQTGYAFRAGSSYPSMAAVVGHERRLQAARVGLPPAITIPRGGLGGGHLGPAHNPFEVAGDANDAAFQVQDLSVPAGEGGARLERRGRLLAELDAPAREEGPGGLHRAGPIHQAIDRFTEQALQLLTSPRAQQAFDIGREPDALRERYGRSTVGQGLLLARRLVEAGVPFVTVFDDGWDNHQRIYPALSAKLPPVDRGLSALMEDLHQRGLLESTLIVVMGEFGRTPRINVDQGRDHWSRAFTVVFAGGGVRGGQAIGASDAEGAFVADAPVTPEDVAFSVHTLLGIDPDQELPSITGRRIQIVRDGKFIAGLA